MIETQVAQLASSCPNHNSGKLSEQLKVNPKESVNAVTMRTGKSMQDAPHPHDEDTRWKTVTIRDANAEDEV
jgi:hypothetical protein